MMMSWYSCICVIRLEDSNMQSAIDDVNSLKGERMSELKKECKIAVDEMLTDYKKLEKENEFGSKSEELFFDLKEKFEKT